mmetsp:Transcript_21129/g.36324  ORF Transcript_21129/g.36324 Transcript_21129/m.36324 type:complete len:116 (-) Transcript_21129:536-883(-)
MAMKESINAKLPNVDQRATCFQVRIQDNKTNIGPKIQQATTRYEIPKKSDRMPAMKATYAEHANKHEHVVAILTSQENFGPKDIDAIDAKLSSLSSYKPVSSNTSRACNRKLVQQ